MIFFYIKMNLYFAYRDRYGHDIDEYNIYDALRTAGHDNMLDNIKVVACPFCGISTSNGEVITLTKCGYYLLYRCLTCQKAAFSKQSSQLVTKKEVEKLYPHTAISDDATFHLAKLCKIYSVSCSALMQFAAKKVIPNDDVIAFYNDFEKFVDENKIDVNYHISDDLVTKFFKDNDIAKKHKIEYIGVNYGNYLKLHINDYSLTHVSIRGMIDIELIGGNYNMITYIDELIF